MKHNFDFAVDFVLRIEGGYVNDKNDKGGETKYGISQKAFPDLKIVDITLEQAKEIYRKNYWDVCRCDELPPSFDIAVFDCAVNQGPKKAIILLQRALGVQDDGVIGKITIDACAAADEPEMRKFLLERLYEYAKLEDFKHFGKGWFNRIKKLAGVV